MSAAAASPLESHAAWRGRIGMLTLILSEASFFLTFIVTYLYYVGKSASGPQPEQVLHFPVLNSVCLLSSSLTVVFAVRALSAGRMLGFRLWWLLTLVLGAEFLVGTGLEWRRLIVEQGLWIDTNLFGTSFYSLVGFHALHVTLGVALLLLVWLLSLAGRLPRSQALRVEFLSWYWHFVDGVWVLVLLTVYVIGVRS